MARLSFLTLLFAAVVTNLSLEAVPSVHALQGMDLTPPMVKRAEHVDFHQRMVRKKRAALDTDVPIDAVGDPTPSSNTAAAPTTSSASSPIIQVPPTTQPATTRPATNTNPVATNTVTTTTSTGATTTSTSTSSSTTSTSTTPTTTSTLSTIQQSTRSANPSTVLVTQTAPASQTSDAAQDQDASFLPKSAIIGLIVAGSCVVVGAAIWTIIRKWKFSPSRHFEDRLEPINWEPTQSSGLPHDPTVAALERASSRNGGRRGSDSNDEHGARSMTAVNQDQVSMTPDFPPPHDFTAGASGAYGPGPGYVDMYRGASPAPGAYGAQYETPNPYDGYDYNNQAYGQRRY